MGVRRTLEKRHKLYRYRARTIHLVVASPFVRQDLNHGNFVEERAIRTPRGRKRHNPKKHRGLLGGKPHRPGCPDPCCGNQKILFISSDRASHARASGRSVQPNHKSDLVLLPDGKTRQRLLHEVVVPGVTVEVGKVNAIHRQRGITEVIDKVPIPVVERAMHGVESNSATPKTRLLKTPVLDLVDPSVGPVDDIPLIGLGGQHGSSAF